MKKLLITCIVLLLILSAVINYAIPATLQVSQVVNVGCTINGSVRIVQDEKTWSRWWPGDDSVNPGGKGYRYNGFTYHISQLLYNRLEISTSAEKHNYIGELTLLPFSNDSVHVLWKYELKSNANPLTRWLNYRQALQLKKNAEAILLSLKLFLEKNENVYGIRITQTPTQKVNLGAMSSSFTHYPDAKEIALMIKTLNEYLEKSKAKSMGKPMINNTILDSGHVETMVAIPVDIELKETKNFSAKKIVTVKALAATVKGGPASIRNAYIELNHYAIDHKLFAPAIPYEVHVTDRLTQADTALWTTQIFLPIL